MKNVTIAIMFIGLISCGQTNTETPVQEHTPQMESSAQLNFELGYANYKLWRKIDDDQKRESAERSFNRVINDTPLSAYADSSRMYLDSIVNNLYN